MPMFYNPTQVLYLAELFSAPLARFIADQRVLNLKALIQIEVMCKQGVATVLVCG